MTKILIINTSAFTIGNIAMSECMYDQILEVFPEAEIVFESGNLEVHQRYLKNSGRNPKFVKRLFDVTGLAYSPHYLSFDFFKKNIKFLFNFLFDGLELLLFCFFKKTISKRKIFNEINSSDLIIVGGGDDITKHYGFFIRIYVLYILKLMKKKIIIYASTIGPFSGFSKLLVINCLKKIDLILCRDQKSYDFLINSGLNSGIVKKTADCVILLKQKSTDFSKKAIKEMNITKKTIIIFLKSFIYMNDFQYKEYLKDLQNFIFLIEKEGLNVLFFSANDADYLLTINFLKNNNLKNKSLNMMDCSPEEGKEILSKAGIIITSRMHPAILATTAGVPVIGISDESKMLEYLKIINLFNFYIPTKLFSSFLVKDLVLKNINNKDIIIDLNKGNFLAKQLANKNLEYLKNIEKIDYQ